MPTPDGKVIIQIDSNAIKASKDFQQLDNSINKVKGDSQSMATQINSTDGAFKRLSGSLMTLKGGLIAAGVAFGAMQLANFGKQIFDVSSQFEQLNVAFEVLAGQQAGQQLVKDLTDLANVTPMTTQGLADNARLLLSFGESAENVIGDLKLLGDISGGNQQKMDSLALAFAQAGSAGRLMGQDLLQMVNAGFNPLQIISEKTGKSMGQLKKEMEQGKIGFDQIKQAMIDATSEGGRFYGMMNKQSETLSGRLSTLSDKWGLVAKNIGDFFLPVAKGAVNVMVRLGDAVLYLQNKLAGLDHPLERAYIGLQKLFGLQKQSSLVFTMKSDIAQKANEGTAAVARLNSGFRNSAMAVDSVTRAHKAQHTAHTANITTQLNDYELLQQKVLTLRNNLLIMATQGKNSGDIWAKSLENYNIEASKLENINKSVEQSFTDMGETANTSSKKISNDYSSLSNQLAYALTAPLSGGANAFQSFANLAINALQQVIAKALELAIIMPIINSFTGGVGGSLFGALLKSEKGNVFNNGSHIQAYAKGGVVNSPTLFPMANGGTGLMGEAGAEAVMPLKRTSNGRLGVEATGIAPNINIYNQAGVSIETIQRPDNETEIFIRKFNNAMASEKTANSFNRQSSRQSKRGVTAA